MFIWHNNLFVLFITIYFNFLLCYLIPNIIIIWQNWILLFVLCFISDFTNCNVFSQKYIKQTISNKCIHYET